jgi:Phage major capsid protein E.
MLTVFERRTLVGVINKRPVFPGLFKELFFQRRHPFAGTVVELHTTVAGKKLLPFVTEVGAGVQVDKVGRETQMIKCARLRPKKQFSAPELLNFTNPGEDPYLAGNVQEIDLEQAVARDVQDLKDRTETTIEYLCAKSVCGGLITVVQDDIKFSIDYRMPSSHKPALPAGSLWTAEGANPLEQLESWSDLIVDDSGLTPDVIVMGTNAWKAFRKNPAVQAELDNRRIDHPGLSPRVAKAYQGSIGGVEIYRYGGTYDDADGAPQAVMHPDFVLFGSSEAETSIEFGLPADLEAEGRPMEYFAKSWVDKDPSLLWILSESRPLPWPKQIGAFVHAKVV